MILAGCATTPILDKQPNSPVPTLSSTTDVSRGFYTSTLTSPDGRIRLPLDCYSTATNTNCSAIFPNGQKVEASLEWLPDNRFAIECGGLTHDSACTGFSIWDMVDGRRLGGFKDYWYQLSPDQKQMIYITPDVYINARPHLMLLDLVSEQEKELKTCPDWLKLSKEASSLC
jgi:hypothetical protein